MAEHVTTTTPIPGGATVSSPAHHEAPHAHHDDHNSPEYIAREKRRYLLVFGTLALLTIITVAVSYLHVSHTMAVIIALTIASIKASLVAAFFMHLISERRFIYAVLGVTIFFFAVLIWGPWHHHYNAMGHDVGQPGQIDTTHSTEKTSGH
jgi:cytochrome c oxidase subunit IV